MRPRDPHAVQHLRLLPRPQLEALIQGFGVATGGTPWQEGMGFAYPENLAIDRPSNVWIVTDRAAVNGSADEFGTNACLIFPVTGCEASEPLLFATGPMECMFTGTCFSLSSNPT